MSGIQMTLDRDDRDDRDDRGDRDDREPEGLYRTGVFDAWTVGGKRYLYIGWMLLFISLCKYL